MAFTCFYNLLLKRKTMGLGISASEVPGRWGKCRLEVTLPASWIRNYTWAPAARLKRYFRWLLDAIKCEHQVDRLLIRIPPSVKLRWKQAVLVWGEGRLRTNYKTRHLSSQLIYSFTTKWLWCLHPFLGLLSIIYFFPRLPAPWGQEPHLSCSGSGPLLLLGRRLLSMSENGMI